MQEVNYKSIGIIHSQFERTHDMPNQPSAAKGITGTVEVYPEYNKGLKDLEGFSHIILIYHFHLSYGYRLEVMPFLDESLRGVFATRAPKRPNQIGISVVKLNRVEKNILHIENVDIINGTPLLDIKPFIPDFDATEIIKLGWLESSRHKFSTRNSDNRFD